MIGHWYICERKYPSLSFPEKEVKSPNTIVPQETWKLPSSKYKTYANKKQPLMKTYLWMGGVYAMENNDTNTDYQKCNSLGHQKWEIVEITIGIFIFFGLRFVFTNSYTGGF